MCGERSQRGKGPPQYALAPENSFLAGARKAQGEPVRGIVYSLHIYGIPPFVCLAWGTGPRAVVQEAELLP